MNFTSDQWILIIGAIFLGINNMITNWRTTSRLNIITEDTKVVLGHVNSKETKYITELASKDTEIALLNGIIVDKDKAAALLAQSVIQRNRILDSFSAFTSDSALQKEIATNTAETVKAVRDIK